MSSGEHSIMSSGEVRHQEPEVIVWLFQRLEVRSQGRGQDPPQTPSCSSRMPILNENLTDYMYRKSTNIAIHDSIKVPQHNGCNTIFTRLLFTAHIMQLSFGWRCVAKIKASPPYIHIVPHLASAKPCQWTALPHCPLHTGHAHERSLMWAIVGLLVRATSCR